MYQPFCVWITCSTNLIFFSNSQLLVSNPKSFSRSLKQLRTILENIIPNLNLVLYFIADPVTCVHCAVLCFVAGVDFDNALCLLPLGSPWWPTPKFEFSKAKTYFLAGTTCALEEKTDVQSYGKVNGVSWFLLRNFRTGNLSESVLFFCEIKMIISTDNDNNFSLTIMLPVRKTTNFYSSLF